MHKILKQILVCTLFTSVLWSVMLITDRKKLNEELIRFHVVANSDSEADQNIKLMVRDAVLSSIQDDLKKVSDVKEAQAYLQENLTKIQDVANQTLQKSGFRGSADVSLCKERFDIRHYDTFSLPAGVYNALRIVIGDGAGKNWWCVSFPSFCVPASSPDFEDTAVSAGFSKPLAKTLAGEEYYEIRFFLLDALGRLENILWLE